MQEEITARRRTWRYVFIYCLGNSGRGVFRANVDLWAGFAVAFPAIVFSVERKKEKILLKKLKKSSVYMFSLPELSVAMMLIL